MRNLHQRSAAAFLMVIVAVCCRGASADEDFVGWNLEPGVGQAHLVMVARVASISRLTVVEGAKTDVALREYRFQPVRVLKGLFHRGELSMTASDLGCTEDGASLAPPLKEGEFRLLILAQRPGMGSFSGVQSFGCVSAAAPGADKFNERVPLLAGPDDPLVGVVEALIRVADSSSRRERATWLVDRLVDAEGVAAVPLLSSLKLRADWAATDGRAYAPLARLARGRQTAVRLGAIEALRDMLASRIAPDDPQQLDGVADALREILESDEANTRVRLAAIEALGHLLALKNDADWPLELLIGQLNAAATYVERAAAVTALGRLSQPQAIAAVMDALSALPLDELTDRELVFARAAVRSDRAGAERVLLARLQRSIAARQPLEAEVKPLRIMRSKDSLPLLLAAAGDPSVSKVDCWHIAVSLGRLGDERALPVLAKWLREDSYLKEPALGALERIDSPAAAGEVRPLLKPEPNLAFKLRIARLLARHGIADGYALTTEHLADSDHTAAATLVLAALEDPRTTKDLSAILAGHPDRRWRAAALSGLAGIGDGDAIKQLNEILSDDRNPLAADAAQAAGLAGDVELLPPLAALVKSRNKPIAIASLVALRRSLSDVRSSPRGLANVELLVADEDDANLYGIESGASESPPPAADLPAETRAAIAESVASIAGDAYVEADVRREALAVARLLGGERYARLLAELADQAELEGAPLLAEVQLERRRVRGVEQL